MDPVFWQLCSIGLVLVVGLPLAFISVLCQISTIGAKKRRLRLRSRNVGNP